MYYSNEKKRNLFEEQCAGCRWVTRVEAVPSTREETSWLARTLNREIKRRKKMKSRWMT